VQELWRIVAGKAESVSACGVSPVVYVGMFPQHLFIRSHAYYFAIPRGVGNVTPAISLLRLVWQVRKTVQLGSTVGISWTRLLRRAQASFRGAEMKGAIRIAKYGFFFLSLVWALYSARGLILLAEMFPPSTSVTDNFETLLASLQGYLIIFGPLLVATVLIIFRLPSQGRATRD